MKIRIVRTYLESGIWKREDWTYKRPIDILSNEDQLPRLTDAEILTSDGKIFILEKDEMWAGFRLDDKLDAASVNYEYREFMQRAREYIWFEYHNPYDTPPEIFAKTLKEAVNQIKLNTMYGLKFWVLGN